MRNYQGLPFDNQSKDVDIVIEPEKIKQAHTLLKQIMNGAGLEYYDEFRTGAMICCHGMSLRQKTAIHIDIIEGLSIKGRRSAQRQKLFRLYVLPFEQRREHTLLRVSDGAFQCY